MLMDELRGDVNVELIKRWWKTLESIGFKISRTNTKHMNCNFNGDIPKSQDYWNTQNDKMCHKEIFSVTLTL